MNQWRLALPVLAAAAFAACGGDEQPAAGPAGNPDPAPPQPPPPTVDTVYGRYVGEVSIGGISHFADALFAPDGEARIYIGGAGEGLSGAIPATRPESASQFVGRLHLESGEATGDGIVIAEGCALTPQAPTCGQAAAATLRLPGASAGYAADLAGSMTVETAAGPVVWHVELTPWDNFYSTGVSLGSSPNQFVEQIAEFAADGDTLLTIDAAGLLFFQSAGSGCTGNGRLEAAAYFNVIHVSLELGSCAGAFAYLNGEFTGIGTFSTSNYWNYDSVLRLWVSRSDASQPPAAITLWSLPIYQ